MHFAAFCRGSRRPGADRGWRRLWQHPSQFPLILLLASVCVSPQVTSSEPAQQVDETEPQRRNLLVLVLGPDGSPVAGAHIHASVWTREPFKANRDYVTDSSGRTVVELPKTLSILRVWARKESHVPLFAQWWKDRQPDGHLIPKEFTFRLEKGTTIGGTIRNVDGQPIAAARVEVRRRSGGIEEELAKRPINGIWLAEGDEEPCGARTTDAEGRWTLDNVPKEDDLDVSVKISHPDYVDDQLWGGLQHEQGVTTKHLQQQVATIVMKRGIRLRGIVVAEESLKRIEDAVVIWGDDPYMQTGSQEVLTDRRGMYRFPPLTPQKLRVTVVAEGFSPQMKTVELNEEEMDEQFSLDASFRLKPGHAIRIRFTDTDGNPIPDVGVGITAWQNAKSLYNHRHPNVLNTKIPDRADANGVYQWTWAPAEPVQYSFWAESYEEVRERLLSPGDEMHEISLQKK